MECWPLEAGLLAIGTHLYNPKSEGFLKICISAPLVSALPSRLEEIIPLEKLQDHSQLLSVLLYVSKYKTPGANSKGQIKVLFKSVRPRPHFHPS